MIRYIAALPGWQCGPFFIIAASSTVEGEWNRFQQRSPEGAAFAYSRLSSEPLVVLPGRQYPLRGKPFRPFWELEATKGERIFYTSVFTEALGICVTVIVGACNDIHAAPRLLRMLNGRRPAYESAYAVANSEIFTRGTICDEPLRVPDWALRKR